MLFFQNRGTIRRHIGIVFVLVVIVPVLVLGWTSYRLSQDVLLDNSSVMMENTMELSKNHIDSVFKEVEFTHLHLINSDELRNLLSRVPQNRGEEAIYTLTLNTLLDSFKSTEDIRYIHWYPLSSDLLPDYRKNVLIVDYADTQWYDAIQKLSINRMWVLEQVIRQDPLNTEWILTQYRLYKDKQTLRPLGIIGVSTNIQSLSRHMLLPHNIEGQRMLIADEEGNVLVDTRPKNAYRNEIFAHSSARDNASQTDSYWIEENDGRSFVTQAQLEVVDWRLLSVIPERSLMRSLPLLRNATFYLFLGYLMIGGWIAFYLFYRLTKPVTELANWMRQVEANNLIVFDVYKVEGGEISYLFRTFKKLVLRLRTEIDRIYESEREKKELEIKALNYQIRPHFLYNILDTIKWRSASGHSDDVSTMIEALSGLLRSTLKAEGNVNLSEELQHVQFYVEIEQTRYRDRFTLMIDVDESMLNLTVPRFILQPLVENAIRHGILKSEGKGFVLIRIFVSGEELTIEVIDSGPGFSSDNDEIGGQEESGEGQGIGLYNVNRRLQLMYGERYRMRWSNDSRQGTTVEIVIPVSPDHTGEARIEEQ